MGGGHLRNWKRWLSSWRFRKTNFEITASEAAVCWKRERGESVADVGIERAGGRGYRWLREGEGSLHHAVTAAVGRRSVGIIYLQPIFVFWRGMFGMSRRLQY